MIERFIKNVKYRWNNGSLPLPGELEPVDMPPFGKVSVISFHDQDKEPITIFRRFRGLLGYGPGWTFKEALLDRALILVLYAILILIFIHFAK